MPLVQLHLACLAISTPFPIPCLAQQTGMYQAQERQGSMIWALQVCQGPLTCRGEQKISVSCIEMLLRQGRVCFVLVYLGEGPS